MVTLFHFILELIKIVVLSSGYALIILLLCKGISVFYPQSILAGIIKRKTRFWFTCSLIISAGLFIFMFTHYGNHGLGDSARIPLNYSKNINEIDGNDTYLENRNGEQLGITDFIFDKKRVYAKTQTEETQKYGSYIVWDLKTDVWTFYKTETAYRDVAQNNSHPMPEDFISFATAYENYWNGWRFWLLP